MKNLHINFMRRLKNVEFAMLINNIALQIGDIETDDAMLKQLLDRMKFHDREMAFLRDAPVSHPLTKVIEELTFTRTEYLQSLRLQIKGKMLSHRQEERTAAELLAWWMAGYEENLYVSSISTQSQLVHGLMRERALDDTIEEAAIYLGLNSLFEAIVELTDEITLNYRKRVKDSLKDVRVGKDLRLAAFEDVKLLIDVLHVMYKMNPNENADENIYYNIALQVGLCLKKSHTVLKSRHTKQKNKKAVANAISELLAIGKEAVIQKCLPQGEIESGANESIKHAESNTVDTKPNRKDFISSPTKGSDNSSTTHNKSNNKGDQEVPPMVDS